jgi:hypothetical protein
MQAWPATVLQELHSIAQELNGLTAEGMNLLQTEAKNA